MIYRAKNYSHLIGVEGFSEKLLENHLSLYEGYIKNANRLLEHLERYLENGEMERPEFSEIKRRLSFELNGIKLHEYYFDNMVKSDTELDKQSKFYKKVTHEFGSYEKWRMSFFGVASMRGVGWAVVIYEPLSDLLMNTWVDQHHIGHVMGSAPILVLDLWEHAILLDYGSNRAAYVDAFFRVINWPVVVSRFEEASVTFRSESDLIHTRAKKENGNANEKTFTRSRNKRAATIRAH